LKQYTRLIPSPEGNGFSPTKENGGFYKKLIYIFGIFLVCLLIFIPKNVWAVTDYDGNGIITHDEKKRYYLEVYGVDLDAPDFAEQAQKAMDTLSEKYNTNNTLNSGTDNASETEKSNANKASNSDKKM